MMMMMPTTDANDNAYDYDDDDNYKSYFFESCSSMPLLYVENLPP
jgi:hypothetical protein